MSQKLATMDARVRANELTLLAIVAMVVMLFAAFTAAYLIRRTADDWQHLPIPAILWGNTVIILLSSGTIELARLKARSEQDPKDQARGRFGARFWLAVTLALGLLFVVGQLAGWRALAEQGLFYYEFPHSAFICMLTGVHAVHLIGGIVALGVANRRPAVLKLCVLYWHFVGIVWLYLLIMLSLL